MIKVNKIIQRPIFSIPIKLNASKIAFIIKPNNLAIGPIKPSLCVNKIPMFLSSKKITY